MELENFDNFAARFNPDLHPMPLLLIEQVGSSDSTDPVFKTISTSRALISLSTKGRTLGTKPLENARVCSFQNFEKAARIGISLGRVANNKICLPDNAISKMHASFKLNLSGQWQIIDVESENGSTINGSPIEANKPKLINNGDGICFADTYHCTFFTAEGFKEYLASIGRR